MRQHLVTQRAGTVADRREVRHEHFHTHTDTHVSHLLVVAQLIVQDDAVGLLRLRPWQREAVQGGADLVHDGNYGGSCRGTERETQNKYILRFNVFFFITDMSLEWPQTVYLGSCLSIFGDPLKHFIGYFSGSLLLVWEISFHYSQFSQLLSGSSISHAKHEPCGLLQPYRLKI